MNAVAKLAVSNLLNRKTRVALTVAAIALSVSLVVSVTSGYTSIEAAAYKFFTHFLGSTDVTIGSKTYGDGVPESLIHQFKSDSRVKRVTGRLNADAPFPEGSPIKSAELIGILRPDDTQVDQMTLEAGGWFDSGDGDVAVIDQGAAGKLGIGVGGTITIPELDRQMALKVVGIVHKPEVMANFRPTIYLPLHTLQQFKKYPGLVTRMSVELNNHSQTDQFLADWRAKLQKLDPNLTMRSAGESRGMLERNLGALKLVSYLGGGVSMITATFIIFSTLSMGVTERQRALAMLRAVGVLRSQVAAVVVLEGMILSTLGALAGVGLGILWVEALVWRFDKLFTAGAVLSVGGITLGVGGSILSALAASLLPAWTASRVSPLEAMTPLASHGKARLPWAVALLGLALVCIDPLILFGPMQRVVAAMGSTTPVPLARIVQFYCHFVVGLEGILLGFFLMSPILVWLVDRFVSPLVAKLLGLTPALLRQQLSSGIWRAAGTCTALMVGLAILVALQTEGRTALNGWKLPDRFPDLFIVDFAGIPLSDAAKLEDIPGIKRGQVMPVAIASPGLPKQYLSLVGQEKGTLTALIMTPDATMFLGIDPDVAFKLIGFDFRQGNATDAERMLKEGDHVIITAELQRLKGLKVGDKLPLQTNDGMKDFTIAAVVWSPGLDVIVTAFDMGRQMEQRTASSVFGSIADAEKYFGLKRFMLFAANLDADAEREVVLKDVQKRLKSEGMRGGDVRKIKNNIETSFKDFLLLISTVAFAAMAVASLGVANTIMASVRSRRWQFGILRSIGVTRSQLLRLVLAEAILLGLVGCALGLPAGLELAIDAGSIQAALLGYAPPLSIPWNYLIFGSGLILAVSVLASLWPAALVARTPTLDLLQAGRASA